MKHADTTHNFFQIAAGSGPSSIVYTGNCVPTRGTGWPAWRPSSGTIWLISMPCHWLNKVDFTVLGQTLFPSSHIQGVIFRNFVC